MTFFWWWHSFTWFSDASSPSFKGLLEFYDYSMFFILSIGILVGVMMGFVMLAPSSNRKLHKNNFAEAAWTIGPMLILVFLGYPSICLLYVVSEVKNPLLTLKSVGHQWFWSYEYGDNNSGTTLFDSYMIKDGNLVLGEHRSLEVDNRLVIPMGTEIRLLTTGYDVIHSWGVPGLGVKIDSVPGRLNQIGLFSDRPAIFYGQCAEICGTDHAFMPIVVECVPVNYFLSWVQNH